MSSLASFSAQTLQGETVTLDKYAGQVVLVVNTASQCGFTPQYAGLESLYRQYHEQGLVILGFPCNQFGQQEPGDATAISSFCELNYGVTFPMFDKVEVNGANAHPLFVWLKKSLPGMLGDGIKWNFTKFLIGRDGTPLARFAPLTKPAELEPAIRHALGL